MRAIKSSLEGAMGITIVSESRQSGWNPCAIDNGGCSHFCFYNSKNYTCECPDIPTEEPCRTGKLIFKNINIKLMLYVFQNLLKD